MRPRHWKQVLKLARSGTSHHLSRGGTFDVSLLEELTFGQFLDMALHGERMSEVLYTVIIYSVYNYVIVFPQVVYTCLSLRLDLQSQLTNCNVLGGWCVEGWCVCRIIVLSLSLSLCHDITAHKPHTTCIAFVLTYL